MTHTNALIHEKSPYLRQHAHNPVEWLPWGEAAFSKARFEDKPIFLSIGYSTCHWCHVMAHESFEDEATAQILNQHFVPVKIDREERPDIDRVYMLFVQASTGSGGWPMSVWLTPDRKPFYGGTYFPPDNLYGRPGFRTLLQHLATAWQSDRSRIIESSDIVTDQLLALSSEAKAAVAADREFVGSAYPQFRRSFDSIYGGFGAAPKFPRPSALNYLLRYAHSFSQNAAEKEEAIRMVTTTLHAMDAGGMHDHLGGGFHRYSVDERWFVPHFEKMLYDQAQLATAYLEAFQVTVEPRFADVAEDILQYVLRDLTSPEGAFYSAEDADSDDPENAARHGEGAFYIWRRTEIEKVLGSPAHAFCEHYGVKPDGNVENDPHVEFTGRNILFVRRQEKPGHSQSFKHEREKLLAVRAARPRPHLDRKVLTSWNAMMISSLVKAAAVLNRPVYLSAATKAADHLLRHMYNPSSGELLRRYFDGESAIPAFADDYALLAQALLDLFESTGEPRHLTVAADLCERGLRRFEDDVKGGFFSTAAGAPDVLLRLKDEYDGAEPAANSVALDVLLRLSHLTGNIGFRQRAERTIAFLAPRVNTQPSVAPLGLAAIMRSFVEPAQTVLRCFSVSPEAQQAIYEYRRAFAPFTAVVLLPDVAQPALESMAPFLSTLNRQGRFTLYECSNFVCQLPTSID